MQNIFETSLLELAWESFLEIFKGVRSSFLEAYLLIVKNLKSITAKDIVMVNSMSLDWGKPIFKS